jgi:hypothetical protein
LAVTTPSRPKREVAWQRVMARAPYIDPSIDELHCGYYVDEENWVRGFLRLPSNDDAGRVRFVEHVSEFWSNDSLPPFSVFLIEHPDKRPICLVDSFATRQTIGAPHSASYPLELLVNTAFVGSEDPHEVYGQATLCSKALLEFLDGRQIEPKAVPSRGEARSKRFTATSYSDWRLVLEESAALTGVSESSATLEWQAEIRLEGEPRTLEAWGTELHTALELFAFLVDRPLDTRRVVAYDGTRTTDLYASWSERSAPDRTQPMFTMRQVDDDQLDRAVSSWADLSSSAPDLMVYVGQFQLFRDQLSLSDKLLTLARAVEQYHRYATRLASAIRPKEKHAAILRQLEARLDQPLRDEHGDWILRVLGNSNRKPLRGQVVDLLNDLGSDVQAACEIKDVDQFAGEVTRIRNAFTHPSGDGAHPEPRELLVVVNRLWFVIRACVLIELGFHRDDIAKALRRSGRRHYLLR